MAILIDQGYQSLYISHFKDCQNKIDLCKELKRKRKTLVSHHIGYATIVVTIHAPEKPEQNKAMYTLQLVFTIRQH